MESVLKRAQEYAVEGANCFCQELTLPILHSERPKLCGVLAVLSATGLIGNGEKKGSGRITFPVFCFCLLD